MNSYIKLTVPKNCTVATLLVGAGFLFDQKLQIKLFKLFYGVLSVKKLENELIIVQRSVSTIDLCKKNEENHLF